MDRTTDRGRDRGHAGGSSGAALVARAVPRGHLTCSHAQEAIAARGADAAYDRPKVIYGILVELLGVVTVVVAMVLVVADDGGRAALVWWGIGMGCRCCMLGCLADECLCLLRRHRVGRGLFWLGRLLSHFGGGGGVGVAPAALAGRLTVLRAVAVASATSHSSSCSPRRPAAGTPFLHRASCTPFGGRFPSCTQRLLRPRGIWAADGVGIVVLVPRHVPAVRVVLRIDRAVAAGVVEGEGVPSGIAWRLGSARRRFRRCK